MREEQTGLAPPQLSSPVSYPLVVQPSPMIEPSQRAFFQQQRF